MFSRYLFRDDVLIASKTSIQSLDVISRKDDRMLAMRHPIVGNEFSWSSFRVVRFIDNTWGWSPMPEEETARLRALLLIQQ